MGSAREAARSLHCSLISAPWRLEWSDKAPPGDHWWHCELVLKKGICGGARLQLHSELVRLGHPRLGLPPTRGGLSASQLKSALQKCVRLCWPEAAVRVAWALAELGHEDPKKNGMAELLRRLPVIAVEDALPPPELPALVWLMAAHAKGAPLSAEHTRLVMRSVYRIASCKYREGMETILERAPEATPTFADAAALCRPAAATDDESVAGGAHHGADAAVAWSAALPVCGGGLVRALLWRASFGGMEGDIEMLQRAAALWYRRFTQGVGWSERLERAFADGVADAGVSHGAGGRALNPAAAVGSPSVEALVDGRVDMGPSDVPVGAIDFHCSDVLQTVLRQPSVAGALRESQGWPRGGSGSGGGDELLELAKGAMWRYSSSISAKLPWPGGGEGQQAEAPRRKPGGEALARAWAVLQSPCRDFARELVVQQCIRMQPRAARADGPTLTAVPHGSLKGQCLVLDFVSVEEEASLLAWLDSEAEPRWVLRDFNGPAYGKRWGVTTDLNRRTVGPPLHPMPPQLLALARRMREALRGAAGCTSPIANFEPNEANALDYRRDEGHHLKAHCDDRQLSGDTIVNLTLAGDAVMTYTLDRAVPSGAPVRVHLPRRSLQVQGGNVRYSYRHAIDNADLLSERRVSITFRRAALTASAPPSEHVRTW